MGTLKLIFKNLIVIIIGFIMLWGIVALITFGIYLFETNYYRYVIRNTDNSIYDKETKVYLMNDGQSMIKAKNTYYVYKKGYYIIFNDKTRQVYIYRENQLSNQNINIKVKELQSQYDLHIINSVDNMDNVTKDNYNYLKNRNEVFKSQGF